MATIAVLGTGKVSEVLSDGFLKHGHDVMRGGRNAKKLAEWKGRVGTCAEAAKASEIIVLAVKGGAAEEVMDLAGAENLAGKTIIDPTNPISDKPPTDGVISFFTSLDDSLMERLQRKAPEARFVKAFSSVGNAIMVNPDFGGQRPTMFICGNDAGAKDQVRGILDQFGWDAEDLGTATAARVIEPLCILWCIPGFVRNDWRHALKVLR